MTLKVPRSKWDTPPRLDKNDLWDFQIPDVVVENKQRKEAEAIYVAIPK